jgi:hypothetical protein
MLHSFADGRNHAKSAESVAKFATAERGQNRKKEIAFLCIHAASIMLFGRGGTHRS